MSEETKVPGEKPTKNGLRTSENQIHIQLLEDALVKAQGEGTCYDN